MQRRDFLKAGALAGVGLSVTGATSEQAPLESTGTQPTVVSTWESGLAANRRALGILKESGSVLDAVERGVMVVEADPEDTSVGYGGFPNSEGVVELDAAVMDGDRVEAGSVGALRGIMHPIAVARKVMEVTPHVMLVGNGARRFALQQGFEEENLLTDNARKAWEKMKAEGTKESAPAHDTIGMVAMDGNGSMAAACTTSGLAWKLPGRVGDSPLIGHGLYCDAEAGGAVATGLGEEVIKVCGSYQVVEFMRQGLSPDEAIRRVLKRILRRDAANRERMVGFVAMRADGQIGFASTASGFKAAVARDTSYELIDAPSMVAG